MVTVRFFSIAAAKKWELHQMEVHNTFLHGDLNKEMFLKLSPGLSVNHLGQACRLKKSLYGIRQAPRCWFSKLSSAKIKYGFVQYHSDYSLFTLKRNTMQLNVLVYVDDLVISGNDHESIVEFIAYLRNLSQGILLKSMCDLKLHAWCDADWAGCSSTRRSLTGWVVYLGDSLISWKTKKQHIVSRSSAEAEYCSMAFTTCELKWLKSVMLSIGIHQVKPMSLYCDSQVALHISQNLMFHERTKHIEVDCHYIRDKLVSGNIIAQYVSTMEQIADYFTKALRKAQFDYLLYKLV
ncbi:retrovirus-related pol polyprotein from transposon TNT 1-94, partial [Tanacetum coccineum]